MHAGKVTAACRDLSRYWMSFSLMRVLAGTFFNSGFGCLLAPLGGDSIENFQLEFQLEKSLEFWLEMPSSKIGCLDMS